VTENCNFFNSRQSLSALSGAHYILSLKYTINMQSRTFSSNLGYNYTRNFFKIMLGFTSYNLLVQLFPKLDSNVCDYILF
jgi:hypothetical protein